jgi:hypothetical protein
MGRYLVPGTMVAALTALAVAAATVGFVTSRPSWWPAAVALAVLGGITPMIYAVNIRIIPVFSRRSWPANNWLRSQVAMAIGGAWVHYVGRLSGSEWLIALGAIGALLGGLLFFVNVVRLFRGPQSSLPAPPLPHPDQAAVDRLATSFTRIAGLYLLVGLAIGVLNSRWQPPTGRWELVWAHALLLGFFLSMASGVSYHVLSRWTGRHWRSVAMIRIHLAIVAAGLPLMLIALARNWSGLLQIAGPLQAAGLILFGINILPLLVALPGLTRLAMIAAVTFLTVGLVIGSIFATDPAIGARLRMSHGVINLFGGAGLLICGVGTYLIPRFFGRVLRWTRLIAVSIAFLMSGAALSGTALAWRAYGEGSSALVFLAQSMIALGFLMFGAVLMATFFGRPGVAVTLNPQQLGNRPAPLPSRRTSAGSSAARSSI